MTLLSLENRWPRPWVALTDDAEALAFGRSINPAVDSTVSGELSRELPAAHALAGKRLLPLGTAFAILASLLLAACGAPDASVASATPAAAPATAATPGVPATASAAPRARPGVNHDAAAKLASAIASSDASAAAALFADDAVFVRWRAPDARGRDAIEHLLRTAFDLCKMRIASVLERATSFVVQIESTCTHPKASGIQAHLLVADLAGDRISHARIYTELFPFHDRARRDIRELEAPETMTAERTESARCAIDTLVALLPRDLRGTVTEVWGTPSCTVLTTHSSNPEGSFRGYVEVDCSAPLSCSRSPGSHRYVDWNGQRLLPFADGIHVEKQE